MLALRCLTSRCTRLASWLSESLRLSMTLTATLRPLKWCMPRRTWQKPPSPAAPMQSHAQRWQLNVLAGCTQVSRRGGSSSGQDDIADASFLTYDFTDVVSSQAHVTAANVFSNRLWRGCRHAGHRRRRRVRSPRGDRGSGGGCQGCSDVRCQVLLLWLRGLQRAAQAAAAVAAGTARQHGQCSWLRWRVAASRQDGRSSGCTRLLQCST